MIRTKDIIPFQKNLTYDQLGMSSKELKMLFDKNLSLYRRSETEEEKNVDPEKVWHHIKFHFGKIPYAEHRIYPYCRHRDLENKLKEARKSRIVNSYKRNQLFYAANRYVYTPYVLENTLFFRFFGCRINVYENTPELTFTEFVRVCIKEKEVWIEVESTEYPVKNLFYLTHPCGSSSGAIKIINAASLGIGRLTKKQKQDFLGKNLIKIFDLDSMDSFDRFVFEYSRLAKRDRIYKNVPDDIRDDLKNSYKHKNHYYMEAKNGFAVFSENAATTTDYYDVQPRKVFPVERFRIYLKNNKLYRFEYNFFDSKWVSSGKDISNNINDFSIVLAPVEALTKSKSKVTRVLENAPRYVIRADDYSCILHQIYLCSRYLVFEQLSKMGYLNITDYDKNSLSYNHVKDEFIRKDNPNVKEWLSQYNMTIGDFHQIPKTAKCATIISLVDNITYIKKECPDIPNDVFKLWITLNIRCIQTNPEPYYISNMNVSQFVYLFRYYQENGRDFHNFINAIIKQSDTQLLLSEYRDYFRQKADAERYISDQGLDVVLPDFLKPSEIRYWHRKVSGYTRSYAQIQAIKRENQLKHEFESNVREEEYKELEYKSSKYVIISPDTPDDMINEGASLSHCVASYWQSVARGKTKIYFLRKTNQINQPYMTMEVRDGRLVQFFGYGDSYNESEAVRKFIQKWSENKNIQINCRI